MHHCSEHSTQAASVIMSKRVTVMRLLLAGIAISSSLVQSVSAQDKYPSRPIKFVVAFSAGGITDVIARLIGEKLSERIGQTIVIDNKGGAGGALGAKIVSSSEPDGYTFLVTTTAVAIGAAAELPNAVNPRTQLKPVAMGAVSPTIIGTKAPSHARNLAEFVRDQKGTITYASAGVGTAEHLTAAYVLKDFNATHVPFRSGGEVVNAVIGKHVSLGVTPVGSAITFIQDGQLQILGVASRQRVAALKDVPTFGESGLIDVENLTWVAMFGPPGLPDVIAQRLNTEVNHVLNQSELGTRLAKMGFELRPSSQQQFDAQIGSEVDKWRRILKETGVSIN
jgi:tripartite-type tricarboxylate transporter receptor subunit TctC